MLENFQITKFQLKFYFLKSYKCSVRKNLATHSIKNGLQNYAPLIIIIIN